MDYTDCSVEHRICIWGETLIITKYRGNNGYKENRVTVWDMRVPRVPGKA